MERQKIMDRIATDIFRIHSDFNLFNACYFYFSVRLNLYILEYEMEGRKVLVQSEEGILHIYSALSSFMHAILFVSVIPKYFKFSTV